MPKVRELVTIWKFDIDDKPLKKVEVGLKNVKQGVQATSLLFAAAAGSLFGVAKLVSSAAREIQQSSDNMGLSTQALQEYRFAAEQAGVEASQLDGALFDLNKTMGEARLGFGSGRVGIELLAKETGTLIDLTGTTEQQFEKIVTGLSKVKDEAKRAAIAEQFFGGNARQITTFLKVGVGQINEYRNQFKQLGGVMDEELIGKGKEFERTQNEFLAILKAVRNEIASELFPAAVEFGKEFKQFFLENKELVKEFIKSGIGIMVQIFRDTFNVLKNTVKVVVQLANVFGGLENVLGAIFKIFIGIQALKLLTGLGQMAIGIKGLIGFLFTLKTAAISANLALFAMPAAIGAIIAAVALIAEDIYTFFQGGDSIFGDLVGGIKDWAQGIIDAISEIFSPITSISDKVSSLISGFGKIASLTPAGGLFNLGAKLFGPSAENKGTVNNNNNNVSGKFDINVTGLSPEQAQEAAREGFSNVIGGFLRGAQRDTTPLAER